MLIARNINATEKFTLPGDSGENPTVFVLGQIDNATRAYIEDRSIIYARETEGDATAQIKLRQRALDYVLFGLKGWTNFKDEDGIEVQFVSVAQELPHGNYPVVAKAALDRLDGAWIEEIGNRIRERAFLSETERKN